jgi:hypothetical protein
MSEDGMLLDHARATTYEVGADLKDEAVGEIWPFALPFDIRHAVCVGTVDPIVVATFEQLGATCRTIPVDGLSALRTERTDEVADLVHLGTDALERIDSLAGALVRVLADDGLIVVPTSHTRPLLDVGLHVRGRLWCAASCARPVAIVPAGDLRVIAYFTSRRLHDPSTIVPTWRPSRTDKRDAAPGIALVGRDPAPLREGPPAWLTRIAAARAVDVSGHGWGIWARRHYSSQKVVIFLFDGASSVPSIVVKLPRDVRFNERIDVDYRAIERVHSLAGHERRVPVPLFVGAYGGRRVAAVGAVQGTPFPHAAGDDRHGALAWAVIHWLGELGASTSRMTPTSELVDPLHELVRRLEALYPLDTAERRALHRHVDELTDAADELPVVFQHGNVADWNLIVGPDGNIVFLDWEFAEPDGLPLWDVFFFLRFQGWPLRTGWQRQLYGKWRPRRDVFLRSSNADLLRRAIATYRRYVDVPAGAIEPLFHLCWAHQCLNAATHETPVTLSANPMFRLLRRSLRLGEQGRLHAYLAVT